MKITDFPITEFDQLHELVFFRRADIRQARRLAQLIEAARKALELPIEALCAGIVPPAKLRHDATPLRKVDRPQGDFGATKSYDSFSDMIAATSQAQPADEIAMLTQPQLEALAAEIQSFLVLS